MAEDPTFQFRTPRVYRYLEHRYVDAFFNTGALRLSSFRNFSKHRDEQRLDDKEGVTHLIHRTSANGGQTLHLEVEYGRDAYVLCGSMAPSRKLMADFCCDDAIVITDTRGFLQAVGNHVPNLQLAIEGPCSYQFRRILERDLGWLDVGPSHHSVEPSEMNESVIQYVYGKIATVDGYFLKLDRFREQVEYRFVWKSTEPVRDHIDILVPEARQFCTRWQDQGEVVAFGGLPTPFLERAQIAWRRFTCRRKL